MPQRNRCETTCKIKSGKVKHVRYHISLYCREGNGGPGRSGLWKPCMETKKRPPMLVPDFHGPPGRSYHPYLNGLFRAYFCISAKKLISTVFSKFGRILAILNFGSLVRHQEPHKGSSLNKFCRRGKLSQDKFSVLEIM